MTALGHISESALDELRARTPPASVISRRVKLARSGKRWVGLCPFHNERSPSFYVFDDGFHCFGCGAHGDVIDFVINATGAGFVEACQMLASEAGLADLDRAADARAPAPAREQRSQKNCETVELARAIARETVPAPGTLAETYLRSRDCHLPRGGALRFHPACPRGGERLPAMIAIMTDAVTNEFAGIHRTFLRPDGSGKIDHGTKKMMLGNSGVIRLVPDDEITIGLGICEGIETGLSLIQRAGWRPVWAAGSAGGMASFPVLRGIECLTLFPDADDPGSGKRAAEACTSRWVLASREVQTIWPPAGSDWNDQLAQAAA